MRLKNILFVVDDIEKSVKFYTGLFGLRVLADFGSNVILSEGLVLEQRNLWEQSLEKKVSYGGHDLELYFLEDDLEGFEKKLKEHFPETELLHPCKLNERGQMVIRLYDHDRHVIEVSESPEKAARRLAEEGQS